MIHIVIPAYNEGKKIGEVVRDLRKNGYKHIVVVDDGSKDDTGQIAEKAGATVLRHMINRGQGAGLQTGIKYALMDGADIIVTFDADGQHHAKDIPAIVAPVKAGKVDVALGSRFLKSDSNTPPMRKLVLKTGALIFRLFYGVELTDSHNGFRALNRKAAEQIEISSDDMAHASEIIEEITQKDLSYTEVPVTITYTDYSMAKGQASLNSIKIFFRMVLNWLLD